MNVSVCPFYIPSLALLRFPRPRCMPLGYGLCLLLSSKNCFYQEKFILHKELRGKFISIMIFNECWQFTTFPLCRDEEEAGLNHGCSGRHRGWHALSSLEWVCSSYSEHFLPPLKTSSLRCIKLDMCVSRVNYKRELTFLLVLLFFHFPRFLQLSYKSMTYDFWLNPIAIWSLSLPLILFLFSPVPSHQNAVTKYIFLSLCWTAATTSSALRSCPAP